MWFIEIYIYVLNRVTKLMFFTSFTDAVVPLYQHDKYAYMYNLYQIAKRRHSKWYKM